MMGFASLYPSYILSCCVLRLEKACSESPLETEVALGDQVAAHLVVDRRE